MSELPSIIQSLQELERMHQLNLELLEHLGVFFQWILDSKIDIPNKGKFESLLHKTKALMNELYCSDSPKTLQYSAIRRKVTEPKSDGEVTESEKGFCKLIVGFVNVLLFVGWPLLGFSLARAK